MALNIKSFTTLVTDQVTAIQAKSALLVDLSIGSLLRAIVESNGGVVLWLQQLIVNLLVITRAATSSDSDLDSWFADYGFTREPATYATGTVTFSRFTATNAALIPVGAQVTTNDGTQTYNVIADTTNAAYSPSQSGYVVAAGTASVNVPVQAASAGAAGNASAGTVTTVVGSISGIDTVNNANAFANGADAESDDDARARFRLWIQSLSKGTNAAIEYAIASVQQGVTYKVVENQNYAGATQYGYFYAVVDDGSGSPSSTFLDSVYTAIDAVRGFTISFNVFGPTVVTANIAMTITTDPSVTHSDIVALVNTAITNYIATLSLGQFLPITKLSAVAYEASTYVTNVTNITINSATSDLTATVKQVIRAGTVVVS
ncbi:baseplate protein [Pantoea dispersa]|uniref:baseplate J/gp47 family protein n=1 Tax=Pantoea dispersa TaxID=59814 RepID=UPI000F676AE9|nr:baseplate J/gp47 family protein [Pantoea dispersa]RRW77602.1 baseplate protein [Pantoea dispersa]